MPISLTKYRIKDYNQISQEADLINKIIEVESNTTDENYKVSVPTLIQTVANNLPGPNNTKSLIKFVRTYSRDTPENFGEQTLEDLDDTFLCYGTICNVEFPRGQWKVVYDLSGPLLVYLDGSFTGQRYGGRWVEVGSVADTSSRINNFNPFQEKYLLGDNVKFTLEGELRLFSAAQELVKSTFGNNQIPAPTGQETDINWQEINPDGHTKIRTWLSGNYKKDEVVTHQGGLYRAKENITVTLVSTVYDLNGNPITPPTPQPADKWEAIGGGGGLQLQRYSHQSTCNHCGR